MASIWQDIKERKILDKDGKVDPLGPYGKQKLTGQEVAQYFRKNKVSDAKVKRAVEVALDLSGAMSVAQKEIKKFFGDRILKSKEVQNALKYANEEVTESYRDIIKMYPRDNDWKKLITKHKRHLDDFQKGKKDLDTDVEDELVSWALDNGEIRHKEDVEDFIDQVLNASYQPKGNSISETNGMVGKKLNVRYRPARAVRGKPFSGKLTSHSTIEKSDLFQDVEKSAFDLRDDCNSIAIRVPGARGSEKDKEKWHEMVNSSFDNGGQPAGLIRGGGLAPSEVKELFNDMKKAAKEFGSRDVLAQSHEISIANEKGKLNLVKGLNAMLKAIDEFGMRNHVSVSGKDGVLTRIQYAANHLNDETIKEGKVHDSIIRRDFPNVWAASAKDKNVLKNFHAVVDTRNHKKMKDAYKKDMKAFVDSLKEQNMMNTYRKMWEDGQKYAPETVSEGKEFKQSDIDKVAKLTDRNEHTKSLIHIAKVMGDKRSFKKLELIDKLHNEYGHLHSGLKSMRDEVYQDLKDGMKKYDNGQDMYGAT